MDGWMIDTLIDRYIDRQTDRQTDVDRAHIDGARF